MQANAEAVEQFLTLEKINNQNQECDSLIDNLAANQDFTITKTAIPRKNRKNGGQVMDDSLSWDLKKDELVKEIQVFIIQKENVQTKQKNVFAFADDSDSSDESRETGECSDHSNDEESTTGTHVLKADVDDAQPIKDEQLIEVVQEV